MLRPRVIPCLLIQGGGLVKTVRFADGKYVGDPINAVKIFNEKEADELMVLDIDATVQRREPNFKLISQLAVECRMPLCYGGGIATAAQASRIVGLGVEKVAVSSAAVHRPGLIAEIAGEVGGQSVAAVYDVRRDPRTGEYEVWTHNGKTRTGRTLVPLVAAAEQAGAGEIVVNAIDRDGTLSGYDIELGRVVRRSTRLPITVLGGASSLDDLRELIVACGVIGVSAGSLFVFKGPYRAVLINYPNQSQRDALARAVQ